MDNERVDRGATDQARALAARRQIRSGVCPMCGSPYSGTRLRRYCSHRCAQRAYVERRKRRTHSRASPDEVDNPAR